MSVPSWGEYDQGGGYVREGGVVCQGGWVCLGGGYHMLYLSPGRDLGPGIPPERYLGTEIPHKGRRTRDTPFGRVVTLVHPSGADKTPVLGAVRLSAHNPEDPHDVTTPICFATPNNRLCVPWLKATGQRNISNYFPKKRPCQNHPHLIAYKLFLLLWMWNPRGPFSVCRRTWSLANRFPST